MKSLETIWETGKLKSPSIRLPGGRILARVWSLELRFTHRRYEDLECVGPDNITIHFCYTEMKVSKCVRDSWILVTEIVNATINAFFISNYYKSRIKSIVKRVNLAVCLSFSLQQVNQQISMSEFHRVQMSWCYSNPLRARIWKGYARVYRQLFCAVMPQITLNLSWLILSQIIFNHLLKYFFLHDT